jgi:hypothetical protein
VSNAFVDAAAAGDRMPMRNTFAGCCAVAEENAAAEIAISSQHEAQRFTR